ncbi:ABC transporter permease [Coprobacter tertius]|uniref:ABC transporter permease n=1 Tax=Coprobacter tertius TaxID=2944915 RepID=A0ABT1MMU2_9BACT|nr:ABC transporter permease [Coprobacter tertius]MCP9612606.1 ABC transporter permease [Coprobacter tertius]
MKLSEKIKQIKEGFFDICYIWRKEYVAVFRDVGVLLFFFALPFAYPLLYALIYNPELVRDVPMVVIDNARTPLSRELARHMDASPNAKVISYCANLDEAKHLMYEKKCYGIMLIPEDFERRIMRGEQGVVTFYSDMSILLNYKGFLIALTDVTMDMGTQLQIEALGGATAEQADMATAPIPYSSITLYNPESGFGSFLIPAILVLILQQSLILGIGMLAGGVYEHKKLHRYYSGRERMHNNVMHIVLGKAICYYSLYIIPTVYILHVVPWMFRFPQLGNQWEIYAFMAPFLLSSVFFAMTLSVFVRERETSFLLFVFTSLLFLFISGITWPRYAMPAFWKAIGSIIPSTWGIEGFVGINTAGASISEVREPFINLWILTGVYFITACFAYRYQIYKDKKRGFKGNLELAND